MLSKSFAINFPLSQISQLYECDIILDVIARGTMTIRRKSLLILGSVVLIAFVFGAGIVRNTVINMKEAHRLRITL